MRVDENPALYYGCCMPSIRVTLPGEVAQWLRERAARNNQSVSRSVAELLEEVRGREDEYAAAMRRFLAIKPRKMEWVGGRKPTREELYDRPCLRRHRGDPSG